MPIDQISDTKWQIKHSNDCYVDIGDDVTFRAKTKMFKWDTNHWLDLLCGLPLTGSPVGTTNNLVFENINYSFEWKPTSLTSPYNDVGGFDWIITIKRMIARVSSISFTYDSQNVVGYLQPALTAQEITRGFIRPDHVVNSIAFYATDIGNIHLAENASRYKTGKIGHLYRPKVFDADGNWAWLDWSINGNTITLTDTTGFIALRTLAQFPITIKPTGDTFGYTGEGGSYAQINDAALSPIRCIFATPPTHSGFVESMSFFGHNGQDAAAYVKTALYDGNTLMTNGVTTPEEAPALEWPDFWRTLEFGTQPAISQGNNDYSMAVVAEDVGGTWDYYTMYDAGGANQYECDGTSYAASFPSPWSTDWAANNKVSIYLTYTPYPVMTFPLGGWIM